MCNSRLANRKNYVQLCDCLPFVSYWNSGDYHSSEPGTAHNWELHIMAVELNRFAVALVADPSGLTIGTGD